MGNSHSQAHPGGEAGQDHHVESFPPVRPTPKKRHTFQPDFPNPSAAASSSSSSASPFTSPPVATGDTYGESEATRGSPATAVHHRAGTAYGGATAATISPSSSSSPGRGIPIGGPGLRPPHGRATRSVSLRYKTGGRQSPSLGSPSQNAPLFSCESPSQYASSPMAPLESGSPHSHRAPHSGKSTRSEGAEYDPVVSTPPSSTTAPRPIRQQRRVNAVPEFMPSTAPGASVRGSWYSAVATHNQPSHGSPQKHPSEPPGFGTPPTHNRPPGFTDRSPVQSPRKPPVPTVLNWYGAAHTVYVSGSFNEWRHRVRLSPVGPNHFNVTLALPPGIHFLKFIVNEEWKNSSDMATAPDDDGNLVNYIRVDSVAPPTEPPPPSVSNPTSRVIPTPNHATSATPAQNINGPTSTVATAGTLPVPNAHHDHFESHSVATSIPDVGGALSGLQELGLESALSNSPPGQYSSVVPEHLYQSHRPPAPGHHHSSKSNNPPTLPPHLSQVLLNHSQSHHNNFSQGGAVTRAPGPSDPNSGLPVPNHVVLNHLFACSIRNGVMAIASTTRYRKKYTTTVYYKPFRTLQ